MFRFYWYFLICSMNCLDWLEPCCKAVRVSHRNDVLFEPTKTGFLRASYLLIINFLEIIIKLNSYFERRGNPTFAANFWKYTFQWRWTSRHLGNVWKNRSNLREIVLVCIPICERIRSVWLKWWFDHFVDIIIVGDQYVVVLSKNLKWLCFKLSFEREKSCLCLPENGSQFGKCNCWAVVSLSFVERHRVLKFD